MMQPPEGWIPVPCDNCGDPVRVDARVEQMNPRPGIYCAMCWPWPLLPETLAPEEFGP